MLFFREVAPLVKLKFDGEYTEENFSELLSPIYSRMKSSAISKATSYTDLLDLLKKASLSTFSL